MRAWHRDWRLRTYLFANLLSTIGDMALQVGIIWTVVQQYGGSLAGVVAGATLVSQGLSTMVGGVAADRFRTRVVLATALAGKTVLLMGASWLLILGRFEFREFVILGVAFGTIDGMENPAWATLGRQLVAAENLVSLTGVNQTLGRIARMIGAPLGAGLVSSFGLATVAVVDAVSFAILLGVVGCVLRLKYPTTRSSDAGRDGLLRSAGGGLGYLQRDAIARGYVIALSALNVFVGPVFAIGVTLLVGSSGWGAVWVGIAEAIFAASAILGGILAVSWQGANMVGRAFYMLALQGFGIALSGYESRFVLLFSMSIIGVTAGAASVWLSGTFQKVVAAEYLGRVSSVMQLGDLVLTPLAISLFALISSRYDVWVAAMLYGFSMLVICLYRAWHLPLSVAEEGRR